MTQEDTQYRNEIIDKDEVLKMARESGMDLYGLGKDRYRFVHHLEAFAKLVDANATAKEREACAKLCEVLTPTDVNGVCPVSDAIRSRGEA